MNTDIEKLLALQEHDGVLFEIESKIAAGPAQRAAIESRAAAAKAAAKAEEEALKSMELERAALRSERLAAEEKIEKFKIRQATVKKNDEYQALLRATESAKEEVSAIEEREIWLLYAIDEKAEAVKAAREKCAGETARLEAEAAALEASLAELSNRLESARKAAKEAEAGISPEFLEAYAVLKKRGSRRPFVVPVKDGRCSGCHIRLSGETAGLIKSPSSPVHCENCGRLVFKGD